MRRIVIAKAMSMLVVSLNANQVEALEYTSHGKGRP